MSANPLSAQPYRGATSKPELTPAAHCSSNPSCCVFPICAACSPVATVHHTAGEPADWRRYFRINFCYLWILGRHDMVIIVNLVPTLRIARCQFVPTQLMIYYRPIKIIWFQCLPSGRYFQMMGSDQIRVFWSNGFVSFLKVDIQPEYDQ